MYRSGQGVEGATELIVAKNRQGPQDTIPLDWSPKTVRFDNTDRKLEFGGGPKPSSTFPPGSPTKSPEALSGRSKV